MTPLLRLFSVDTVWFTVLDYPMSYIEFIGTVLYLASVILIARKNILTWPVGIVSVILYALLFYQIQLYSDTIEQLYYLIVSVYGWIYWKGSKANGDEASGSATAGFRFTPPAGMAAWAAATLLLTGLVTLFMARIHLLLPTLFPLPASFPFLDALTTVMSFIAMFLMARKRIESWGYWIIVDVIGVILYYVKGVRFISLLYLILLVVALRGFIRWFADFRSSGRTRAAAEV